MHTKYATFVFAYYVSMQVDAKLIQVVYHLPKDFFVDSQCVPFGTVKSHREY